MLNKGLCITGSGTSLALEKQVFYCTIFVKNTDLLERLK